MPTRQLLSLLLVVTLAACGGGGGDGGGAGSAPPAGPTQSSVTKDIGPAGATVSLQGLDLVVPAKGVMQNTRVVLDQLQPGEGELASFRLSPAGKALELPASLTYAAANLPTTARFFWVTAGEQWMLPGSVTGNTLRSQISSFGYDATGAVQLPPFRRANRAAMVQTAPDLSAKQGVSVLRAMAKSADKELQAAMSDTTNNTGEAGRLVVQVTNCKAHVQALSGRLQAAANIKDMNLAAGIFNDLEATKEACAGFELQILEQRSCQGLATAIANANAGTPKDFAGFQALTVPLFAASAFVQKVGVDCPGVDQTQITPLIEAKFDQFLTVLQASLANGRFAEDAGMRELQVLLDYETSCQDMGLTTACSRLTDVIYPKLLDGMRKAAFDECRSGSALSLSQWYAIGSLRGNETKFFDYGNFSLAAVAADMSYCTNPSLGLRVFADASTLPEEIVDRATTLRPLVALGNYPRSKDIAVPRNGSLTVNGQVRGLLCPNGSPLPADLVVRLGTTEIARRSLNGDTYTLNTSPLDLVISQVLAKTSLDPDLTNEFTLVFSREGGGCSDGEALVLREPFTLFEIKVNLPPARAIASKVSAGNNYTCALTNMSGVQCWGLNTSGQLGTGDTISSSIPRVVPSLTSGVTAISTGYNHACAIVADGKLKCWGENKDGQLGVGNLVDSSVPVDVPDVGTGVIAVSAGLRSTCAITSSGLVKCWGANSAGQLGNGTKTPSLVPTDVVNLGSSAIAITVGFSYACAVTSAGALKCWGLDDFLTLGNDRTDSVGINPFSHSLPVNVTGLNSSVIAVSASYDHTCALIAGGLMKCWGYNGLGQLGNGSNQVSDGFRQVVRVSGYPIDVLRLEAVAAISLGFQFSCALSSQGGAKCWGRNSSGELGSGSGNFSLVPRDVTGLASDMVGVSAGLQHACGVSQAGGLKCWGLNSAGQLGNGTQRLSRTPVKVVGFP